MILRSFGHFSVSFQGFPRSSVGKESACNVGDLGSTPGSQRSPEKGMATHFSILAWRIPWTEDPGRPQSMGLQGGSDGKASAWNAEDPDLIPGSGRSLGEGNGKPLQYSGLENSMSGGT